MTEAEQCLICLENFTEDEAYIPDLECECAIFVHWACWEPWTGECLYCRETTIEYEEPIVIPVTEQRHGIGLHMFYNEWTIVFLHASVTFICLYFFILLQYHIE